MIAKYLFYIKLTMKYNMGFHMLILENEATNI